MDDSQRNFNFKNREALLGVAAGVCAPVSFSKGNLLVGAPTGCFLGAQGLLSHQGLLTL